MVAEEKLSVLIPVKVTQSMAREVAVMAGGVRRRGEYIRRLVQKDIDQALSQTEEGRFCAKLVIALRANPKLRFAIESLVRESTRSRIRK